MNDTAVRHILAFIGSLICLMAFVSGYYAGPHGWWWVAASILIIYGGIYKYTDNGGHGGKHH